jgi:cytochrome c-type biogenesis protein CcmH
VGCPNSAGELNELRVAIANNQGDQPILDGFVARYGAVVLAAPTGHGFDVVAWIAPFAVFGAALLGTILLVRRWSVGRTALTAAHAEGIDPEDRSRLDQVRRDTDGGF